MAEIRELEPEEISEIESFAIASAEFLGVSPDAPPKDIVTAINTLLCAVEDDEKERPEDDIVMGLGLLVAFQYTRALDWKWAYVSWEGDFEAHSIISPDAAIAITPIQWVNSISKKEATTNVLLNFNMVEAGNVPPAKPGECLLFQ